MRVTALLIGVIALLVSPGDIMAYWHVPPTFLWSATVNTQSYTGDPRLVQNTARFSGAYDDPDQGGNAPLPDGGDFPSNVPLSRMGGYPGPGFYNFFDLAADTWRFNVRGGNYASAQEPGGGSFANTTTGVVRWYVLRGASAPVSLRMDLAVQGYLRADTDAWAVAHTSHTLTFIASPSASLRERPLAMNGAVLPPGEICGGFGVTGTVPDQCFTSDGAYHRLNYAIRSNPFTVEPDVPFFLAYTVGTNAAVDTNRLFVAPASAASSWEILPATSHAFPGVPELTPEGFVVDLDGNPESHDVVGLGSLGYSLGTPTLPELDGITPNAGGAGGWVTARVSGAGLAPGAAARLVRPGEPDVGGTVVAADDGGRWLDLRFDLESGPSEEGLADVVMTNEPVLPASSSATLPGAFTIESKRAEEIQLSFLGRHAFRSDSFNSFWISMTNPGNVDAYADVTLDGLPQGNGFDWWVTPLESWYGTVQSSDSEAGTALLLPTTRVPPGDPVLVRVTIVVPDLSWEGAPDSLQLHLVREE